jgi:hypothetical protein
MMLLCWTVLDSILSQFSATGLKIQGPVALTDRGSDQQKAKQCPAPLGMFLGSGWWLIMILQQAMASNHLTNLSKDEVCALNLSFDT